jgi:hypothetical protein
MENIEVLENEREYGETKEQNLALLSEKHLIRIIDEWDIGVSPSVYVGKVVTIESFAERPYGRGFKTKDEAKETLMSQGYRQTVICKDGFVNMLIDHFEE